MANWNDPQNSSNYVGVLAALNDKINNLAKMFFTGDTNLPNGTIRLNDTIGALEKWNGSTWDATNDSNLLGFSPTWTPGGSMGIGSFTYNVGKYRRQGNLYYYSATCLGTLTGTASNSISVNLPIAAIPSADVPTAMFFENGNYRPCHAFTPANNSATIRQVDGSNFVLGTNRLFTLSGWFQVQ